MIVRHRSPFVSRSYPVVRASDSSFDRAFEQLTQSFFEPRRRLPAVDASWVEGSLVLTVDLPGIPSEAVTVNVAGRALTLGVGTDELQWERTVQLGNSVDPDKVSARHVDGRLTVTVGAVDVPEVRTVAIDTTPAVPAIESASADENDQSTGTSSTG
jgi:HSP20 family molecular chaperone IbpA